MARSARQAIAGLPYLVTLLGHNRERVFADDADRRLFIERLQQAVARHKLSVHAYALLPAQVQLLATAATDTGMAETVQALGRSYVREFNRRHDRRGTLWEGRYRSALVEPQRYLLACQRHIELAPVRAGLAPVPGAYPWSSHRHYLGLAVDPLVRPHPSFWALGNTPFDRESAYRRLFDEGPDAEETEWLARRSFAGRPIASEAFQRELEATRGLRLMTRPVGRPRRAGRLRADAE
ncbi:MAG TPA: transposase [Burkholderiaceae bacterium]|nr:transposase [Burkholderiaceae bacterium]